MKIKRNQLLWGLVILVGIIIILSFGYFQFGWFNGSTEYLISITAESETVVGLENEEGCFELTLKDADHVVFFSDRPVRKAMRAHPSTLLSIWSEEFAGNPPNADLQLFDEEKNDEMVIVTLNSAPTWNEDTQTFTFKDVCPISVATDDSFKKDDLTIATDSGFVLSGRFSKGALFIDTLLGKIVRKKFDKDDGEVIREAGEAAGEAAVVTEVP